MTGYTDEKLFELLKSADSREAFAELFIRYQSQALAIAIYLVKDVQAAEDVVQEYFVEFWDRRAKHNITSSVRGYIYKGIRLRCIDYMRLSNRTKNNVQLYVATIPEAVQDVPAIETMELSLQLNGAINTLPNKSRQAFYMHYVENKSHAVIAGELNTKVQTIKNHISISLKLLREKLKKKLG